VLTSKVLERIGVQMSPGEVEGIIAARPMHIERFLQVLRPKIEKEVKAGGGVADNDIVISDLPAGLAKYNATYAPTGALVAGYPAFAAGPDKHLFRHPEFERWILQPRTFDPTTPTGVAHIPCVAGPVPTWTPALRRLTYLYPSFNNVYSS
jgi:hypothetical protein